MKTCMVNINNFSLTFPVNFSSRKTLRSELYQSIIGGNISLSNKSKIQIKALNNINLKINKGDKIAFMGDNGSGKTTILRAIAGVYKSNEGTISVSGKIASMLSINLGMDMDASGRENIVIKCVILGFKADNIKKKIEEIIEFSDLGMYIDLPIRIYSSGMLMRLSFAIITSTQSDIIIMDEWLSVGDKNFASKAEKRLYNYLEKASCLILATHDRNLATNMCNKIIHLKKGSIEKIENVCSNYK